MADTYAHTDGRPTDPREQELKWPARQHPDDLILPDAHPTRFPGTWVAIFEGALPMDQVTALEVEGFTLYKHVVACGDGNLQVTIREEPRPGRDGPEMPPELQERYDAYEHPYKTQPDLRPSGED